MTRFSDPVYSGFESITSGLSSRSTTTLTKSYDFAGSISTTAVTRTGTFPPGVQNITAAIFITQQGSATVSNKVTVSAGGTNLLTIDQFGSAIGYAGPTSVTSVARITMIASACANPPVPTGSNNGGEIPFAVTFLPVSADRTGTYRVTLTFNRADQGLFGTTS